MPKQKRSASRERQDVRYGIYRIIAAEQHGEGKAVSYLGKKTVLTVAGDSAEQAMENAKAKLDERMREFRARRTRDVPSTAEYEEALRAILPQFTEKLTLVLATHADFPNSETTVEELARRSNSDTETIVEQYMWLGKRIANLLGYSPSDKSVGQAWLPILSIATVQGGENPAQTILGLHPEMKEALPILKKVFPPAFA